MEDYRQRPNSVEQLTSGQWKLFAYPRTSQNTNNHEKICGRDVMLWASTAANTAYDRILLEIYDGINRLHREQRTSYLALLCRPLILPTPITKTTNVFKFYLNRIPTESDMNGGWIKSIFWTIYKMLLTELLLNWKSTAKVIFSHKTDFVSWQWSGLVILSSLVSLFLINKFESMKILQLLLGLF